MTRLSLLLALLPIVSAASGQQPFDPIIRNGATRSTLRDGMSCR
jgi:hypothetical protein